ncbi:MAG: (d)CMP kinase [Clostridia bacterium]|nr:(d)CMP kinase [Clostridia bacterium]
MFKIAIDGPSGAGKSSVAKAVAKELSIVYVDTGALYRTIGLFMTEKGISTTDKESVISLLPEISIELKYVLGKQVILLNGKEVGDNIRTPEIAMAASNVSAIPEVRAFLLDTQRDIAKKNSVIMDGRDIGTVILPDAEVKIFLTASPEARAKRRYDELLAKGQSVNYDEIYKGMLERDKNDSTRAVAPCVPAPDAVFLDNSKLTPEKTVQKVIKIVKKKINKNKNFYMKAHRIVAPVIRFFQRVKRYGLENIPKDGGLIICSNHIAAKDVVLIAAACPRQIRFVAKKELFKVPLIGWLIRKLDAIKLDRGGGDVGAIKTTINLAKQGEIVSIFPQGHRFPGVDPATTPIKNGAGMIAYHSACDVLPVCIKTKKDKYHLFGRVEIHFGKPIPNDSFKFTNGGSDEYKAATEKIFAEILNLRNSSLLPPPKEDK